ncbi:DUF1450 domain-containing protein [Paenibacillus sp. 1001270B_150601_E10]|uniref:DUF1450 domain-containing protein n=1 Tax=Paenibacillus sp. 1001270B_150601_E10 TaxID=2787079 RepID=UPI0018A0480F|nr:DUF1450 domain-containing protein [Paenibacillus sp. 1001270B_150601_E10]
MSNNDIRICDKCRHIKMKSFLPKVKKLDPNAEIKIGCKSYCGHCTKRVFIYINGRYVTAPTEDEAIEKAKPFVK